VAGEKADKSSPTNVDRRTMVHLSIDVGGLRFANPVLLAAGILGVSPSSLLRVARSGAGGVVTKSLSIDPRDGYPNPVIVEVEGGGFVNAVGLANPGVHDFREELRAYLPFPVPLVGSIFGYGPEEYGRAASALDDVVDGFELNVSCPSVAGVGAELGSSPDLVSAAVRSVKAATRKPAFVKLSPNVQDIVGIGAAAQGAGADGVVAINTVSAMVADGDLGGPLLRAPKGGLSGRPIRAIALRCIYELHKALAIPIIGCGGVSGWKDAVDMMAAGASAVQIGSAIRDSGLGVFADVADGIREYLEGRGCASASELVGVAVR
jgi:dihydroorotate dehydrogenase (NAD+) catalytic subunit